MQSDDVRICYAILDTSKQERDKDVRQLLLELNLALDSVITPVVGQNIEDLLDWAACDTDYTHMVIYNSGTFIRKAYTLASHWQEHCRGDWVASGHIIWKSDDQYPWLHEQLLAVNILKWSECGKPDIGHQTSRPTSLCACERSVENIHDDYTPLWLKSAQGDVQINQRKPGWNLIHCAMANGMIIVNVPIEIRNEKHYVYPTDNGKRLATSIRNLRQKPWQVLDKFENDTQQRFVDYMRWVVDADDNSAVFVFNTGETAVDAHLMSNLVPTDIWTTASGFKSFAEWYYRGAPPTCRIHTYDRNTKSLALWKHIHAHWNGTDIYGFMQKYDPAYEDEDTYCWGNKLPDESIKQSSDRQEQDLAQFFGGKDAMRKAWKTFQQLDHHYLQCNLIEDPMSLSWYMKDDSLHFVWLNNIFYFRRNILQYGLDKVQQSLLRLMEDIHYNSPNSVIHGECAQTYFGNHPGLILQNLYANPAPRYHCHKKTYPTLR